MGSTRKPQVLDLFAGAGGFSLGFHAAGFQTVAAVDQNGLAVETLKANFESKGTAVLQRDLSIYTPKKLIRDLKRDGHTTKFDVIIGGPPCQGWSSVGRGKLRSLVKDADGKRLVNDPRNRLYKRFLGFVRYFKPKVFVMENVSGMLSHNGKNFAEIIAHQFHLLGYRVTWGLANAADYGVPQSRRRLIFVGVRKNLRTTFRFPSARTKRVTLREAIGDLPIIRNGSKMWRRPYKPKGRIGSFASLMRKRADARFIYDHVCRTQNSQDLEAFRLLREGGKYVELPARLKRYRDDIFRDKYRKLRWDDISGCVTAHLSRDCYTHIHPSQARTISVREAARIQSFPDSFHFSGSMGDKFRLIGNAVPPLMAEAIAKALKMQVFGRRIGAKHRRIVPKYRGPMFVDLSPGDPLAA